MLSRFNRFTFSLIGIFALLISPFIVTPVQAVDVALLSSSTLANGTAMINLAAPTGTACEVAVGSSVGSPNYQWFNSAPCTTFRVDNLPAVSKINIRVFAGGPAQDFVLNATTVPITPAPTPVPVPLPVIKPKAVTFISPIAGQKVAGATTLLTWTNQSADNYLVIVGSGSGKSDYGSYSTKNTSVTINNLPQNNKKVYVRVTAQFANKNLAKNLNFISAKPVVVPVPPPTPIPTPTPTPTPTPLPPVPTGSNISAVWANEGGDKVVQEDLRASNNLNVTNSVWNGNTISIFGAKNEVVNFNVILEAKNTQAANVSVSFDTLTGPNNFTIKGKPATGNDLYQWTDRNIELFYVRYLEIKGLSAFMAGNYDEQQLPARLRATDRQWVNRPAANKNFPDIAVPIELHSTFTVAANKNQSIWADIYIPKNAPAGIYNGTVNIKENGVITRTIPVQLTVKNFALPDEPNSKTMLYMGYKDLNERYLGEAYPAGKVAAIKDLRDKHFLLAHRHKISLIDASPTSELVWNEDAPFPDWISRLNGTLFSAANGYDGPGVGVGNGVYAIGPYGSWGWKNEGKTAMWNHTNNWADWFANNAPGTEYFLHLIDEPQVQDYQQIEQWASWINNNPGSGSKVPSMVTMWPMHAQVETPSLDYVVSGMTLGETDIWQNAVNYYQNTPGKKFMMYNGGRPGQGSFMTDDDGVALRELAWGQYKKNVSRWFYWESTYYNNTQGGTGQTNVFKQAMTFGGAGTPDSIRGLTGWNYSNGDGVLFYPGTDKIFPTESYNVSGPIASLRLKFWRRGIQDVDYLTLAAKVNPAKTQEIVNRLVPKAMWEVGVENPADPTYLNGPVSWSDDPSVWEAARLELANIIEGK